MALADDIAALGQQLQAALLKLYQPRAGGLTSLGFIPTGFPVSIEDVVQADPQNPGQEIVNPAELSEWLRAAGVDSAIQIDIPTATVLGSPVGSGSSIGECCQLIARYARPYAPVSSPTGERVQEELASAAAVTGPGVLPLSTVPSDWPLPTSTVWNVFEGQLSSATQATVASPPAPTTPPTAAAGAPIWQLRQLPVELRAREALSQPSSGPPPAALPAAVAATRPASQPLDTIDRAIGAANLPVQQHPAQRPPPSPAPALDVATAASASLTVTRLAPRFLANAQLLATAPVASAPVLTSTDQTVSVTLSVEHTFAAIDRSPWWQAELIGDSGWYIPGLARGSYVGESSDPAQSPYAMPVAIVLARNLSLSGTWSSADASSLIDSGVVFGPFALQGASLSSAGATTTISAPGVSLIALFCEALPVLPPGDPPAQPSSNDPNQRSEMTPATATHAKGPGASGAADGSDIEDSFFPALIAVCKQIGCNPVDLLAVMKSESNVRPDAVNPNGGATGLIQFMPATLRGVGWTETPQAFAQLSATDQLPYVQQFLAGGKGMFTSAGRVYQYIFLPATMRTATDPDDAVATKGDPNKAIAEAYAQNEGLDLNKDGKITLGELQSRMQSQEAGQRWTALAGRLQAALTSASQTPAPGGSGGQTPAPSPGTDGGSSGTTTKPPGGGEGSPAPGDAGPDASTGPDASSGPDASGTDASSSTDGPSLPGGATDSDAGESNPDTAGTSSTEPGTTSPAATPAAATQSDSSEADSSSDPGAGSTEQSSTAASTTDPNDSSTPEAEPESTATT